MSNNKLSLAVVILTYNEEKHIARAIQSVQSFASQIFVIDSGSKDKTVEIAQENGAEVIQHPFINYAKQLQWALDHAPITAQWVMRLDADEIIEADLAQEIHQTLPVLPFDTVGVCLKLKRIFMNKWIRHGGLYPLTLLRIWRYGQGRIEDRWMDEHIILSAGNTITLNGSFADHNLNDLTFFTDKHNKYATREAIDVLNQKYHLFSRKSEGIDTRSTSTQAAIKRKVKEKIYNRMPFALSTFLYFLWRYIFRLGFLDGLPGLVYHFLQGYWYRFLVGAKIMELEKAISGMTDKKEILKEISRLTGHKLADD